MSVGVKLTGSDRWGLVRGPELLPSLPSLGIMQGSRCEPELSERGLYGFCRRHSRPGSAFDSAGEEARRGGKVANPGSSMSLAYETVRKVPLRGGRVRDLPAFAIPPAIREARTCRPRSNSMMTPGLRIAGHQHRKATTTSCLRSQTPRVNAS